MKPFIGGLLFAAAAFGAASAAADHKSEYKAYMAALDAGKYAEAAKRGEAAWRAAETELGEAPTTAILAFNYAELVAVSEPAKAIEPYARVKAIAAKVATGIADEDIDAGLAFATFAADPGDRARAKPLEAALNARRAKGLPVSRVSAYGWLLLARKSAAGGEGGPRKFADLAIADADALQSGTDKELLRTALVYAAIGRIAGSKHTEEEVYEAVKLFARAFPMFPPQKDIDSFDRLLATALVWRTSINALVASADLPSAPLGSRLPAGENLSKALEAASMEDTYDMIRWVAPQTCKLKWAKQKRPTYPTRTKNKSVIGSALVGYDVKGTAVERSIVLADIHESGFGEAARNAMENWGLAEPAAVACEKNHLMFIQYMLKR